jgi:hypothetical protein
MCYGMIFSLGTWYAQLKHYKTTRTPKIFSLIENDELLVVFPCKNNSDLQQILTFSISFLEIMIHLSYSTLDNSSKLWNYSYRTKIVDCSIVAKVRIRRSYAPRDSKHIIFLPLYHHSYKLWYLSHPCDGCFPTVRATFSHWTHLHRWFLHTRYEESSSFI